MAPRGKKAGEIVVSSPTVGFLDALVDRWASRAAKADVRLPNQSIQSLVSEALEVAAFVDRFLVPAGGLPGLAQAGLPPEVGEEIRELALAVAHVQATARMLSPLPGPPPLERAAFILGELSRALSFLLDVGGERHPGLARLVKASQDRSRDGLALSLQAFATLADKHRARLASLPELDPALIDEAVAVAAALREAHATRKVGVDGARAHQRRALRLGLGHLLQDRVSQVRRAARYVFRHHPDVLRFTTSQYRREHRGNKGRSREKAEGPADGGVAQ